MGSEGGGRGEWGVREGEVSGEGGREERKSVFGAPEAVTKGEEREGGDMEAVAALVAVDERTLSFTD